MRKHGQLKDRCDVVEAKVVHLEQEKRVNEEKMVELKDTCHASPVLAGASSLAAACPTCKWNMTIDLQLEDFSRSWEQTLTARGPTADLARRARARKGMQPRMKPHRPFVTLESANYSANLDDAACELHLVAQPSERHSLEQLRQRTGVLRRRGHPSQ